MKLLVWWVATACAGVVFAASCSIQHRSEGYACTSQAQCMDGRRCIEGYCVLSGSPSDARTDARPFDARPDARPDALVCPGMCTSCDVGQKTCQIDCTQVDCTGAQVVCPAGYNCDIRCTTPNSCNDGIDCTDAESCALTCTGNGSCHSVNCSGGIECNAKCTGQNSCRGIQCAGSDCDFTCDGVGSCRSIDCDTSCACDIRCGVQADCSSLFCPESTAGNFLCRPQVGRGCSSLPFGCDNCTF